MNPTIPRLERIEAELADLRRRLSGGPLAARAGQPLQVRLAKVLGSCDHDWPGGDATHVARLAIRFVDPAFDDGTFSDRSSGAHAHALDPHGWSFFPVGGLQSVGHDWRVRTIPADAVVTVAWYNGYWWLVAAPEIYRAKVQTGRTTNYDVGSGYVPLYTAGVKLLAADGATEVGDAFNVNLDVPESFDPYLFEGDVIRICLPANQIAPYTVTACHHIKRLNPMLWYGGSAPRGFQIADGTNGTLDFRGCFLRMGSQTGGDVGGATGGNDTLGTGTVQAGGGATVVIATDNRPAYRNVQVLQRVS